jgi:hypothetical protein
LKQTKMLTTAYEGEDLPHRLMWAIVEEQATLAKERERDWSHAALISMVFAFHAMEAYLNYVGLRLAPEIWSDEKKYFAKSGFNGRLREVMERSGLSWNPGKRPLQTVLQLKKLRDAIAHGKPEKLAGNVVHAEDAAAPYPKFKLRPMFTPKSKMERAVHDVEQLANEIQIHAKQKLEESGMEDVWFRNEAFQGPQSFSVSGTSLA